MFRCWGRYKSHQNKEGDMSQDSRRLSRQQEVQEIQKQQVRSGVPSFNFAVVIVRQPRTGRFLAVKEAHNLGWWLPAGRVDPGETFEEAALRETMEEAGVPVKLTGILEVQFAPKATYIRMRVVFLAEPIDDTPPKSIPDEESEEARWVTLGEYRQFGSSAPGIRGPELLIWGDYVEKGGVVHPLSVLSYSEK